METPEPILDVAQLGLVELLTPQPEASLGFFRDIMGMSVSGRDDTADPGARLEAHHLERGGAQQGPGLGLKLSDSSRTHATPPLPEKITP